MKSFIKFLVLVGLAASYNLAYTQNCTVTGTSPLNWANPGPTCTEGGNAGGKSVLIIPAGFTLDFDSNGDTWSGTRIEIFGTLIISKDVTINSSIDVKNGGRLNLQSKLSMGTAAGCGYNLTIRPGGLVDVGTTGSDRLSICGVELMKGNGSCNTCGGTNSGTCAYNGDPYCEPASGFVGPLGYSQGGYNGTLPVKLADFTATLVGQTVALEWKTLMERNFDRFVIERSSSANNFETIGELKGQGLDAFEIESKYSYVDKFPVLGFNYYRLKAVDLDGSFEYFDVRGVSLKGERAFSIFPNPSSGKLISYDLNFAPSENDYIIVVDNIGLEILRTPVANSKDEIVLERKLPAGVYLVKFVSSQYELIGRLLVIN